MKEGEAPMCDVPLLGPDFTTRVMRRADAVRLRRKRWRRMMAGAGAVLIAVAAGVALGPRPGAPQPVIAIAAPLHEYQRLPRAEWNTASGMAEESGALSAFFPDASPLARFVERYSAANSGLRVERGGYFDAGYRTGGGGL